MKVEFINEGAFNNYRKLSVDDAKAAAMSQSVEAAKAKLIEIASKKIVEICKKRCDNYEARARVESIADRGRGMFLIMGKLVKFHSSSVDDDSSPYDRYVPKYNYENGTLVITLHVCGSEQTIAIKDNSLFDLIDEIEQEIPSCRIKLEFVDYYTVKIRRFMSKKMFLEIGSKVDMAKFIRFLDRFEYAKPRPEGACEIRFAPAFLRKMNYGSTQYDDRWWSNAWSNLCPNLGQIANTIQ